MQTMFLVLEFASKSLGQTHGRLKGVSVKHLCVLYIMLSSISGVWMTSTVGNKKTGPVYVLLQSSFLDDRIISNLSALDYSLL